MLPKYKQIIFDEAHELAEIDASIYQSQLGSLEIKNLKTIWANTLEKASLRLKSLTSGDWVFKSIFSNIFPWLSLYTLPW